MATKPVSKKLNDKQKEILARKLGYEGPMNMFEQFVKSDTAMERKYNTVVGKFMAKGGMAKKYAEGGAVTVQQLNEQRTAALKKAYDEHQAALAEAERIRNEGWEKSKAEGQAWRDEQWRLIDEEKNLEKAAVIAQYPDVEAEPPSLYPSDRKSERNSKLDAIQAKYEPRYQSANDEMNTRIKTGYTAADEAAASIRTPADATYKEISDYYSAADPESPWSKLRASAPREPSDSQQTTSTASGPAQPLQPSPFVDQSNLTPIVPTQAPAPTQEYLLSKSDVPRADAEAEANRLATKYGFDNEDDARRMIADIAQMYGVSNTENQLKGIYQQAGMDLENFIKPATTTTPPTTATGTAPTTTPATTATTTPGATNVGQTTATTTATLPSATMANISAPTKPEVPQIEAAKVQETPEQLVTGQAPPAQATTIQPTTVGTAATVAETAPKPAATVEAATATPGVTTALQGVQPATGVVSPEAQVQAQTMEPTSTKVSDLAAATGEATMVQPPPARTVQEGELVSGPTVDMGRVEQTLAQAQAAQGEVTTDMTVAGQLQKLTADFDATNPPTWAAGAIRNVNAVLAQRGLGASSLAGQAVVQAALESALPIAAADAKVYQDMGIQNLANRQQMAVLTAQQRATFLGQEFDQAFQTRAINAATISEIANINFTAEQQIALENARLTNTVNLANLSNQQALIMAEAAQIANLETANLNNRQQAAVLNAQAFLQMDMANLANEQQIELFKAQSMVNSLLTDAAAENAARQFNATSINQVNQFYDGLTTQIKQFNAAQINGINQFNVSQVNAVAEFNATAQNARDQFNAEYRRIIDQSNAEWRRNIALADTAAVNRANEVNAANALGITTIDYNNLWQTYRDQMEMAWKTGESALDRETQLAMQVLAKQAQIEAAKYALEAEKAKALGGLTATVLDKSGVLSEGGKMLMGAIKGSGTGTTASSVASYLGDSTWTFKGESNGIETWIDGTNTIGYSPMDETYFLNGQLVWSPSMSAGEVFPDGTFAGAE